MGWLAFPLGVVLGSWFTILCLTL